MKQIDLFAPDKMIGTPSEKAFKAALLKEFKEIKKPLVKKLEKRGRLDQIFLPEQQKSVQESFPFEISNEYPPGTFPQIFEKNEEMVRALINEAISRGPETLLGLDFEFNPATNKISIAGVALDNICAGCFWTPEIGALLNTAISGGVLMVGHFVLGADKPQLEFNTGVKSHRDNWRDSMLTHYLAMQCLTKSVDKKEDEGALGFMDLGSAATLWTRLPIYKKCRGAFCQQFALPCPKHRATAYCATDAWAGLEIYIQSVAYMNRHNIPFSLYHFRAHLTQICLQMEDTGINIDEPFIKNFDKNLIGEKEKLFPKVNETYVQFNPNSWQEAKEWFKERHFNVPNNQKKVIKKIVEEQLFKHGYDSIDEFERSTDTITLSEVDDALYRLFQYKDAGKGIKAWFSDKVVKKGKIHPRFVTTGSSLNRLSSSRPNFQNWPVRGFGALMRRAVIPQPGCWLMGSDAGQLEHRMVMDDCGVSHKDLGEDFFMWVVKGAGDTLVDAEKKIGMDGKDVPGRSLAKVVAHSSNYLTGFKTFYEWELGTEHIKNLVKKGALIICEDWEYAGKIAGFTGIRLSEILFRDKTHENRKRALDLQFNLYYNRFNMVPAWHRRVAKEVELGYTTTRAKNRVELLDSPEKNLKVACAGKGQGEGAIFIQEKMFDMDARYPDNPMCANVHDELIWDNIPRTWTKREIEKFVEPLSQCEVPTFPGLLVPFGTKLGPNMGEMVKLKNHDNL